MSKKIHILHIIYKLSTGGLENGLVNIINNLPINRYKHSIVCVTESTSFRERIKINNISIYELHKKAGLHLSIHVDIYNILKKIKPDIVHTRNLATIEYQLPAFLSGVPVRIHGEHGWDVHDFQGKNKKYIALRRIYKHIIQYYIPLSDQIKNYLSSEINISENRIIKILNGVDTEKFYPRASEKPAVQGCPFLSDRLLIIGAVGRMQGVKDQITLVKAFVRILKSSANLRNQLRLIIIGDGPIRDDAISLLQHEKMSSYAWLPGDRNDIPDLMRLFDIFVLPSTAEGISNVILEAMASALPVVATNVGGNHELVDDGQSGLLVKASDIEMMATTIEYYIENPSIRVMHGKNGLEKVLQRFSLKKMVEEYDRTYSRIVDKCI